MTASLKNQLIQNTDVVLCDAIKSYDLSLYCFVTCDDESSCVTKDARGVIFHGDNVAMRSYPYTVEHRMASISDAVLDDVIANFHISVSIPGTVLRLFYIRDTWFLSTHRKINAFNSRWGSSESFGSQFTHAIGRELGSEPGSAMHDLHDKLDRTRQYIFMLPNTMHLPERGVTPNVLHTGTIVDGEIIITDDIGITKPRYMTFESKSDVIRYISGIGIRSQGLMCYNPTTHTACKILSDEYSEFEKVRGGAYDVRTRYVQLLESGDTHRQLVAFFPEKRQQFDDVYRQMVDTSRRVHHLYIRRYVHKDRSRVLPAEYTILRTCHAWHVRNRFDNIVSRQTVWCAIAQSAVWVISALIIHPSSQVD
jgi:hypothetical protein